MAAGPPPPLTGPIEPPAATLRVDSRSQAGVQGTYTWEPAPGQTINSDATFPIPNSALAVPRGDRVRFTFAGDAPQRAELEVYPVPAGSAGRPEAPSGDARATIPLAADGGVTWTVDLPAGEYLVLLRAGWPAGQSLVGFWIAVEEPPAGR